MKISPFQLLATLLVAGTSLLTGFSSVAHAGTWTVASVVSNRTPNTDTDSSTLDGGGGGRPFGTRSNKGAAVAGTVTTTFEWSADPNLPAGTDVCPPTLDVLEYGDAEWGYVTGRNPIQHGVQGSGASAELATFSPSRRPRLFMVQVQTPTGTADNGLGTTPSVGTDSKSGSSKGYKVGTYPVAANQLILTRTLSASVSNVSPAQCSTYWTYAVNILTIEIHRNGVDVTDPKPETPVMVGERNEMDMVVSPLPADFPPITYQWTIPGEKIKDFLTTGQIADPNATPPKSAIPFTGHKDPLTLADLQSQSPHFYWYNGSFGGDAKVVTVVATIAGNPITKTAKFKIYRPQFNSLYATYVAPDPVGPYAADPLIGIDDRGYVSFGPHTNGLSFIGSATNPNIPPSQGQIALQQITSFNVKYKKVNIGTPTYEGQSVSSALDTLTNDQIYTVPVDTTRSIAPNANSSTSGTDAPGVPLRDDFDHVDSILSFEMYLMYKPSGGIWVPLGKVDWGWTFIAERTPAWTVTSYTPTAAGNAPDGTDEHEFPQWGIRGQDVPLTTIAPW